MSFALSWHGPSAHAATNLLAQNDREILAAANEEIKYLTAKVAALEKLTKQNRELVEALDAQVESQQKTITALKSVTGVDDKLLASYQTSVDDAKKQLTRLEGQVSFWRKVSGFGLPVAAVLGAIVGVIIGRGN